MTESFAHPYIRHLTLFCEEPSEVRTLYESLLAHKLERIESSYFCGEAWPFSFTLQQRNKDNPVGWCPYAYVNNVEQVLERLEEVGGTPSDDICDGEGNRFVDLTGPEDTSIALINGPSFPPLSEEALHEVAFTSSLVGVILDAASPETTVRFMDKLFGWSFTKVRGSLHRLQNIPGAHVLVGNLEGKQQWMPLIVSDGEWERDDKHDGLMVEIDPLGFPLAVTNEIELLLGGQDPNN